MTEILDDLGISLCGEGQYEIGEIDPRIKVSSPR